MGLLNFPIRRIFYFIVENFLFSIYTNKGVGSFSTPRLNTCTILATERQECIQCYCEGTLGLVFLSIVVYHCIRSFVDESFRDGLPNIPIALPCADDPVCVAATEDF